MFSHTVLEYSPVPLWSVGGRVHTGCFDVWCSQRCSHSRYSTIVPQVSYKKSRFGSFQDSVSSGRRITLDTTSIRTHRFSHLKSHAPLTASSRPITPVFVLNFFFLSYTMLSRALVSLLIVVSLGANFASAGIANDNVWKLFSWSPNEVHRAMKDTVLEKRLG